jgi:hypothetical protein
VPRAQIKDEKTYQELRKRGRSLATPPRPTGPQT